jgi:hypothetical protein
LSQSIWKDSQKILFCAFIQVWTCLTCLYIILSKTQRMDIKKGWRMQPSALIYSHIRKKTKEDILYIKVLWETKPWSFRAAAKCVSNYTTTPSLENSIMYLWVPWDCSFHGYALNVSTHWVLGYRLGSFLSWF